MKKLIALVLALVMCFALCACGESAAPAATEAPAAEPAADAAADTAAVEYPEMTLKLSHHNAVDQPIHEALTKWATMINEQSGGKITIDIYPAASLYNQTDAQDAVQMGTLDMCLADCSQLSSAVPAFALTAMPFLYDSYETAGKVIFGEVGAQLDHLREKCLSEKDKRGARKLEHSYFRPERQETISRLETAEYRDALKLRQIWCEGTFAAQKRSHNLTRVLRRGLEAAEDHCLLSAVALNLKRMIKYKK